MNVSTIGLDLAKNVFQVHGVDAAGRVVVRQQLRRNGVLRFFAQLPPCLVGVEACATAHHWARELSALGHEVRLLPPAYVKAYVRRGKSDAIDAAAICEAVQRPGMRFVPVKTCEEQATLMLHRVRERLVSQRTQLANMIRAHMAEFGLIAPLGIEKIHGLSAIIADETDPRLPPAARLALRQVVEELVELGRRLATIDAEIIAAHRANPDSTRLATQPGVGPIIASALTASVPDPSHYRSARDFAAALGITPKNHSTGGKQRLGRISKMGDRYLRMLLVLGATSVVGNAKRLKRPEHAWILRLLARRPVRVVITAVANKMARTIWAMMVRKEAYRSHAQAA
jgi:transposase